MLKIIGLVIVGLLIIFAAFIWHWQRPIISFDPNQIPKGVVTANPVEFDRIYAISKFRSAAGHDYSNSWDGEICRSMKHYFNMGRNQDPNTHMPVRSQPTATQPNIKIFAPFDGTIESIDTEQTPIGKQVHIRSSHYPNYYARLFHIDLLPEFNKLGTQVKSGQQIGIIGPKDGTDVAIQANTFKGPVLLSVFEQMTDTVFGPYQARGFKREDFIINRQYRDTHPLSCGGGHNNESFIRSPGYDWHNDYVLLKNDPFSQR